VGTCKCVKLSSALFLSVIVALYAGILTDFEYNSTDFCRIVQFLPDIGAIYSVLTIP